MIDRYTAPTPNGWKASVVLEELELPYNVKRVNILEGDQRHPDYIALNPNSRISSHQRQPAAWNRCESGLQKWIMTQQ
jgi:hypothetical protein